MKRVLSVLFAASALLAPASAALAWGDTGHRMVGRLGMEALPASLPAFLRTPQAVDAVEELAREPDRWRGAGKLHDSDRDAAHFIDLDDEGRMLSGAPIEQLPPRRLDFEVSLGAARSDVLKSGYLPYAIIDGWQQLAKDFSYLRVEEAALAREKDSTRKTWYARDLELRKALIVRDIGVWAHYVGDGSQPLHLSIHYNGWGDFPNPDGFTLEHIHGPFEAQFVRDHVPAGAVRASMRAYQPCQGAIDACVSAYLRASWSQVTPLYQLDKTGGSHTASPDAVSFTAARIADGATELRNLVVDAWAASEVMKAGYHGVSAQDVEHGADAWEALHGDG